MKYIFSFFLTGIFIMTASAQEYKSLYEITVENLDGEKIPLNEFRGKVALVVNTASNCGFTGQYKDLESVYQEFKSLGFVVLAFPSNDFAGQEPGSNSEIKSFCELKYKTTFPVFAKGPVTGEQKQLVYKFLTESSDPKFQGDPGWNFVKFLVNREGKVIGRYSSMTSPTGSKLKKTILKELKKESE